MKSKSKSIFVFSILLSTLFLISNRSLAQAQTGLKGAYDFTDNQTRHVIIFADGYFVHAAYDQQNKDFKDTEGGPFKIAAGNIEIKIEFDSQNKEMVDSVLKFPCKISGDKFELTYNNSEIPFTRLDDGAGALSGAWRISGRMQENKFNPMPPGDRKTIKILSGSRFQWIALNTKTKEFFGTGGGNYTFADGKYTENLEFFPRDNNKVGTSLTFNDKIEGGEWYHTGKSSTGTDVFEIWKKASAIAD